MTSNFLVVPAFDCSSLFDSHFPHFNIRPTNVFGSKYYYHVHILFKNCSLYWPVKPWVIRYQSTNITTESTLAALSPPLPRPHFHLSSPPPPFPATVNMAPKKQGQHKKTGQKTAAKTSQTNPASPVSGPNTATTPTTNYDELQGNEVTALQAIYGDDFLELKGSHSAWKKSEPTFDIRVKAPSDEDIALTLGVVLVATYPKSPPLLTLKAYTNLKDATVFKIQKFVEDQPAILAKEEQEMIFSIIGGIQEILQEAAEAKAAGKALPTLEEERAAHEAALVRLLYVHLCLRGVSKL